MAEEGGRVESMRRAEEAVAQFIQSGQFENAGLMLLRIGDHRRAAQAFWKGGQFKKAAECALRSGYYAQAGEAYSKAGEHLLAAKAYTQAKEMAKAASAYEAADKLQEAARMHLLARNYLKAGEIYDKLGDPMRSALAYEQAMGQGQAATPSNPEEMARMAQILERVKQYDKAAEIYLQMQQVTEALMAYLRAGEVNGAAKLYASCQGNVGWEILEMARRDGVDRLRQVAEMFFYAKDFAPSGEAFLLVGDCGKAARAFEAGGDYLQAADCFVRAGMKSAAARMFERCGRNEQAAPLWVDGGDYPNAAQAYERASLFFEAGELYVAVGQVDKAVELFQKVPDIHPHFLQAADRVAKILTEKGFVDQAVDRYRSVLRKAGLGEETLPLQYHLALILMERGSFSEARVVLREIATYRTGYRDVADLLSRCEERMVGKAAAPPPAAQPVPPPPVEAALETVQRVRGMEALQDALLLQELTLGDLRTVLASGRVVELARGATIIEAGATGQTLFILLEGLVKVTSGRDETEEILAVLVPGEHFGEMSLLEDAPTSANVVAAEPSVLFALDRKALEGILTGNDPLALKFYRAFVKTLSQRLRKVNLDLAAAVKS
jgi:tetratricopeptide (TPR) repeat protein